MIDRDENKGQLIGLTIGYHFIEGDEETDNKFIKGMLDGLESYREKYKKNSAIARAAAKQIMEANGADLKGM